MTDQILANIDKAISILEAIPEKKIDLKRYKVEEPCGTIACAVGWCASDPHFIAQGMRLTRNGDPDGFQPFLLAKAGSISLVEAVMYMDELFGGDDTFDCLFAEYGNGVYDADLLGVDEPQECNWGGEDAKPMTDKELAIARLRHHRARLFG